MEHRVDDVGFIRAMVGAVAQTHTIDRRRLYATGISTGGMMAYRLACEASDVFAAIGVVAGSVVLEHCAPSAPVAVIHIHGTADEYVPLMGGIGRKSFTPKLYAQVGQSVALWTRADGCAEAPLFSEPVPGVSRSDYAPCRGGTEIVYELISGGGHSWPGGERMAKFLDPPSTAIAATREIWRFFAGHPTP
jgi:polyhydroxybutyrate depolymerase